MTESGSQWKLRPLPSGPTVSRLLFIQQMSSQRRKPHLRRHARPHWRLTPEPDHKKQNDGVSAIASMRKFIISSGFHTSKDSASSQPQAILRRLYSSHGGSMRITSNFVPKVVRSNVLRSTFLYVGGVARSALFVPLEAAGELLGVLQLLDKHGTTITRKAAAAAAAADGGEAAMEVRWLQRGGGLFNAADEQWASRLAKALAVGLLARPAPAELDG